MAKTPKWALNLAARECSAPTLVTWRRANRFQDRSSGRYMTNERRLIVTAGSDRRDQRLVLLHEIAHANTPNHNHDAIFWTEAWRLYDIHGLTSYALKREARYKAAATVVAARLGVRGAKTAAKAAAARRKQGYAPRGICPMPAEEAEIAGYRTPHTHYVGASHGVFMRMDDGTYEHRFYTTPARSA